MLKITNYNVAILATISFLSIGGIASETERGLIKVDPSAALAFRTDPLFMTAAHPRNPDEKVTISLERSMTFKLLNMAEVLDERVPESEIQNLAANIYSFANMLIGSHFDLTSTADEKIALRNASKQLSRKQCMRHAACGCACITAGVAYMFYAPIGFVSGVHRLMGQYVNNDYQVEIADTLLTPPLTSMVCGCCQCAKACRTSRLAVGETNLLIVKAVLAKFEKNLQDIFYDKEGQKTYLARDEISKRLMFVRDFLRHPNMVDFFRKYPKLDLKQASTFVPKRISME